jgi:hypothetical protein
MFTFIQNIFAYFGFEKSPLLTIEDRYTDPPIEEKNIENNIISLKKDHDNLDDAEWVVMKRKLWKKNNISHLKQKETSITPEKMLVKTSPLLKSDIEM